MPEAVILGGGQGECLREGDDYIPKLLTMAGGKPLLERHIERLKAAGLTSATLCLSVKADAVRQRFGDGSRWGMRLRYHVDESPLGTAGSVKALGPASLSEDIVLLIGDSATDLKALLQFHASHKAMATLAATPRAGASGPWVEVGPGSQILDFPLKPTPGQAAWTVGHSWVIRRDLLHLVPDERPSDFLMDVFPAALKHGETLAVFIEAAAAPKKRQLSRS